MLQKFDSFVEPFWDARYFMTLQIWQPFSKNWASHFIYIVWGYFISDSWTWTSIFYGLIAFQRSASLAKRHVLRFSLKNSLPFFLSLNWFRTEEDCCDRHCQERSLLHLAHQTEASSPATVAADGARRDFFRSFVRCLFVYVRHLPAEAAAAALTQFLTTPATWATTTRSAECTKRL